MIPLIYTIIVTHLTMVATCIYLHRGVTHKAVEYHPVIDHFFRLWLWLTDGVIIKQWVATHRRHHRFSDVSGDPHSPMLLGIKQVAVVGFFETCLYRYRSFAPKLEIETYGAGVKEDWLERNLYIHQRLGLLLMLIINVLLFGRIGILIWLVQLIWTPLWSNSVITGIAHWRFGYRHPDAKDNSRNFPGLGFFIIGDQLHSNHHADPASPKLSQKWYEFDLGWFYIRILRALGLAKTRDSV